MPLTRLIYYSSPSDTFDPASFGDIAAVAQRNNRERDLSGALLFDQSHFIQVLEGERAMVSDCYNNIVGDSRHKDLRIIQCQMADRRSFPTWDMLAMDETEHVEAVILEYSAHAELRPETMTPESIIGLMLAMSNRHAYEV
jgi:hypothetical protein